MAEQVNLIFERDTGRLFRSFDDMRPASAGEVLPPLRVGDSLPLRVYEVADQGAGCEPRWATHDASSDGVRARIGVRGVAPQPGTRLVFTYSGQSTGELEWGEFDTLRLERELNALTSVDTAGGVDVYDGPRPGSWKIVFRSAGETANVTVSAVTGSSVVATESEVVEGDYHLIVVEADAWAEQATFSAISTTISEVVTVAQEGSAGEREVVRIGFSQAPESGCWEVITGGGQTAALDFNASAGEVEDAINDVLGAATVAVVKVAAYTWEVRWLAVGVQTNLTLDLDGLSARNGVSGTLALTGAAFAAAVAGRERVFCELEVVAATSGETLARLPVAVGAAMP